MSAVFDALDHESQIRPTEYEWSLFAWRNLPTTDGGVMDLLAHAKNAAEAIAVFVPYVSTEKSKRLADRLVSDPKLGAWIQRGVDELKEWWDELAKDPNFDPESGDDDENPQGGDE